MYSSLSHSLPKEKTLTHSLFLCTLPLFLLTVSVAFREASNASECESFAADLSREVLALVSVYFAISCGAFCTSLKAHYHAAVVEIIRAINELAGALTKRNHAQANLTAQLTGRVWDACKQMAKLELSNFVSFRADLAKWSPLIKDAIQEMNE